MKLVGLSGDHLYLDLVNWCYRISNEELYRITETFEDFQKRQQLKWMPYVTGRENNDINIFNANSNKRLGMTIHLDKSWEE